jgi:hypothetical protein
LALLWLAATPGAVAAGNAGSTIVFTEPLEFAFPAGMCSDLPEGLSIDFSGTLRGHFHVSVDANGVVHVSGSDTITGTAVDSDGATYRFNYHDAIHAQDAGFPVEIVVTDHFNLVGNGAANQLHTFFVLRILFVDEDPQNDVILFENEHGDPEHCDPL